MLHQSLIFAFLVDDVSGATAIAMKTRTVAIRTSGYDGPISVAIMHAVSQCYIARLLAFKNMQASVAAQQAIGGYRYVLCRPVSALLHFFQYSLRPILEPKDDQPFVFVQVVGQNRGSYYDAKRDGFGRYCGQPNGLNLGTSVRTVRHVVSTEAVRCALVPFLFIAEVIFKSLFSLDSRECLLLVPGKGGHGKSAQMCVLPTCTRWKLPTPTT